MRFQNQLGALAALYNDGKLKRSLRRWWNFAGAHTFLDRSQNRPNLVLIVAGYKPRLWPLVFPRFKRFLPADSDVCIVCPGKKDPQLETIAAQNEWSILFTSANKLGLAQNLAIRHHPTASTICKLDEDIFISQDFLEFLFEAMDRTEAAGIHRPGFVAPLINVNGFTARPFLETIGKLQEFEARFGILPQQCMNTPVWSSPDAAAFLWENTSPFDTLAARFAADPLAISICHHRFSIGAILLSREIWTAMHGFSVAGEGLLGAEEGDLCAWCVEHSRAMVVAHRALVGHAGFQPQLNALTETLEKRQDLRLSPG